MKRSESRVKRSKRSNRSRVKRSNRSRVKRSQRIKKRKSKSRRKKQKNKITNSQKGGSSRKCVTATCTRYFFSWEIGRRGGWWSNKDMGEVPVFLGETGNPSNTICPVCYKAVEAKKRRARLNLPPTATNKECEAAEIERHTAFVEAQKESALAENFGRTAVHLKQSAEAPKQQQEPEQQEPEQSEPARPKQVESRQLYDCKNLPLDWKCVPAFWRKGTNQSISGKRRHHIPLKYQDNEYYFENEKTGETNWEPPTWRQIRRAEN